MKEFLFSSESVTEGHPDKVADQISDAILDEHIAKDPSSRVAVETLVSMGFVIIAGEITSSARVDYAEVARKVIKDIGYDSADKGFDAETAGILTSIHRQSEDIAMGVLKGGAGDQGMMFGFAINENPQYMPTPILLAHSLTRRLAQVRKEGKVDFILPDGKSQVTVLYKDGKPHEVKEIVVSTQHKAEVSRDTLKEFIIEEVVKKAIPQELLKNPIYHINPTGAFVKGGPAADTGLTGRKIIVDTYGGFARHGGGAFSGKDPSKVDRSAAYYARYVAKNLVAAGVADKLELQVAYAIGEEYPLGIFLETFGTEKIPVERILAIIEKLFDFRPQAMIEHLQLRRPIYRKTAAYGHFGRDEEGFTWEELNMVEKIKELM